MADYAGGAIGESFKCTYYHVEREIGYLVHFRTNVANLKVQIELLTAKRDDVKEQIKQATMNGEVILKKVETWLSTVEDVLGKATNLDEKASEINRWFKGWFFSRFLLGRRAQKDILMVQWLLDKEDAFGERVAYRRPVQDLITSPLEDVNVTGGSVSEEKPVKDLVSGAELKAFGARVSYRRPVRGLIPAPLKVVKAIGGSVLDERPVQNLAELKAFGARVTTTKQVIEALRNDGTSLLGVYGMPGVGKTILISSLAIHLKEHKIFDEVVVVTLTQTPEIKSIQGDIANGLDLKLEDEDSLATRALRLSQRLSHDLKTLIVLDNLWQEVNLADVGIPRGFRCCKVVFTTRSEDVCNSMDTAESRIKVEVLSPEDSWDLFRKKAGHTVDSPAFQSVARDVLNECQGLPLLIVALGKALYRKDKTYWDAALQALQDSTILPNPNFTDLPKAFSVMKLSYDYLESEETKLCFLFCCLFPDGYHISMEQLFHYMTGEKILTKASTLQAARFHLHVIVDKLVSSCLLLQAKSGCIVMHDVIRDVALAIASDPREGHEFVVKAGMKLNGWPNMQLVDCKRLSFITTRGNHMSWSLPNQIQARHLLTLSFHGSERLVKIPAGIFKETPNLLVVDLSYTGIKVLPQAIMSLGKLQTLLLEGCFYLNSVHLSNTMKKLEILSLRYSAIESITVSRKMTTLKLLDLSYTSKLEHIGQNIISSFIELEELYLFESFRAWEPELTESGETIGRVSTGKDRASSSEGPEGREDYAQLSEVASLRRLTSLEFHVENPECLSQSIPNWQNLTRFKIVVGVIDDFCPFGIDEGILSEKSMYIELGPKLVADWVIVLLARTKFLQLRGSRSLSDLVELNASAEPRIFQELEVLLLSKIESGTSLIQCDMLVILRNLKKLVVANCEYLQKLIAFEVDDKAVTLDASSSSSMINTVKFSNIPPSSMLLNLTYLRVCACAELKFLFPMSIIQLLLQLEMLYISDCSSMEMMIEDDTDTNKDKVIFPRLRVLSLEDLKNISHIVQQAVHLELPTLEELTVNRCPCLKKLPLCSGSVPKLTKLVVDDDWFFYALEWEDQNVEDRLSRILNVLHLKGCRSLKDVELLDQWHPRLRSVRVNEFKGATLTPCNFLEKIPLLENMVIENSQKLKMIDFGVEEKAVEEQVVSVGASSSSSVCASKCPKSTSLPVFANLRRLRVSGCSRLKYLCPMRVIRALLQLEKLFIHDCARMEMVIKYENAEDNDKTILPKLMVLSLHGLQRLSHIVRPEIHVDWPKLEELTMRRCKTLKKLPFGRDSVPKLSKILTDDGNWFDALECDDQQVKERLDQLACRLDLSGCTSLKDVELLDPLHPALRFLKVTDYKGASLIPCGVLRRLSNLNSLLVLNSRNLKMMIEFDDPPVVSSSLSAVTQSKFSKLPPSLVFPNLTRLKVSGCNKLKCLLPIRAVLGHMQQLKELHIKNCNALEMIIEYETAENYSCAEEEDTFFPNLTRLKVSGCDKLKHLLPMTAVRYMLQLKVLEIIRCNVMETVIGHQAAEGDSEKDKAVFPKLESLRLWNLPQLSSFVRQDILFDWPSLENFDIYNCLGLKKLPLGHGSMPKLKDFWARPRSWFDGLEWEEDQDVKSHLESKGTFL
ncbi:hypothetical protein ACHQM5_019336 [Ranunculus cassubicifolius]